MTSLRARLTLAHQVVVLGVLLVAGFAAYWTLSTAVHAQLDAALLALAETELSMLPSDPAQPISVHDSTAVGAPPSFERLDRLVQIVGRGGEVLARSSNLRDARLPVTVALLDEAEPAEAQFQTLHSFGNEPVRMVTVPVGGNGPVRAIQVAGSLDDVNHVVRVASTLFVVMGLALLLAVGGSGLLLTRGAFRAIDQVVSQAQRIGDDSLSRRLPHPGTRDEIGRLVQTLNAMLERIEQGFDMQRRFTADAAHEIRSPLSRLRTELEVALRRPREPAEYVDALRSCLEEVDRLTLLVEELLALARLDAGQESAAPERAELDVLVAEMIQRQERVARAQRVRLRLEPCDGLDVQVARGPARLALANLLDNAVKFSPEGGCVTVALSVRGDEALVRVSDEGPGVAAHELPLIFERFYRGASARAGTVPGVGLGLAVTRAMLQAYGGSVEAALLPQRGLCFTMHLPLLAPEG